MRRPPRHQTPAQAWRQFLATLPPALRPLAQQARQCRPPCLLCGQPFHTLGVFLPYEPTLWGAAAGYQAGCVYALCAGCTTRPDRATAVEAHLWAEDRGCLSAPWN